MRRDDARERACSNVEYTHHFVLAGMLSSWLACLWLNARANLICDNVTYTPFLMSDLTISLIEAENELILLLFKRARGFFLLALCIANI